jgi:Flp pilus assembly protein TadD
LGVRLGERGETVAAQALFESAVARQPAYVEAWLNLSVCYDAAGRSADARRAFGQAFALDRDGVLTLIRRFMLGGRPERTQALLEHLRASLAAASP